MLTVEHLHVGMAFSATATLARRQPSGLPSALQNVRSYGSFVTAGAT